MREIGFQNEKESGKTIQKDRREFNEGTTKKEL